jgi:diguanylate cyclase (GGDEF)-like protein
MSARPPHTETTALGAGQPAAAEYARALERGVAWLKFEPPVEAEYLRSHALRVQPQVRFWQVLQVVIGIVAINAILGGASVPGTLGLLVGCAIAHLVVTSVLLAFAFGSTYVSAYLKAATILTPVTSMAFATIVAGVIHAGGSGAAALTVNIFGLFFFSGLLMRQALPTAVLTLAAFSVALTAFRVPTALAAYSVTSLFLVFGLAAFVAWDTQRAARIAFLQYCITRADATRDALTGLANRRHFDGRLDTLWRAAGLRGQPLTVMLVDVDHFKAYNDGYGHQAGDEALRAVARAIAAEAGSQCLAARFGGEEMAVLAAGIDAAEAEALAGRIRAAVEALEIPHAGAPEAGRVTVSIGGTCLVPLPGRSATGALQLADQNLYAAKRQGRNRVVFQGAEYAGMQTGRFRHGDAAP